MCGGIATSRTPASDFGVVTSNVPPLVRTAARRIRFTSSDKSTSARRSSTVSPNRRAKRACRGSSQRLGAHTTRPRPRQRDKRSEYQYDEPDQPDRPGEAGPARSRPAQAAGGPGGLRPEQRPVSCERLGCHRFRGRQRHSGRELLPIHVGLDRYYGRLRRRPGRSSTSRLDTGYRTPRSCESPQSPSRGRPPLFPPLPSERSAPSTPGSAPPARRAHRRTLRWPRHRRRGCATD